MTTNKVILVMTKSQLKTAHDWVDNQLPTLYDQYIADKIDITTLQQLTPRCLNKLILTTASTKYVEQLIKCTSYNTTQNTNKQLNRPPRAQPSKPIVSFDEKLFPPLQQKQPAQTTTSQPSNSDMAMTTATSSTYDYHAELDRITKELETTMQTKFENAIMQLDAKFNQRLDQIDQKFEQYFCQMEPLTKNYAALQTLQDNHAQTLAR